MEVIATHSLLPSRRVRGRQQAQLKVETSELRDRASHCEEVGGNGDLAREGHEVSGVAERGVQTLRVALLAHETAALTADIAAGQIKKSALDVYHSHPLNSDSDGCDRKQRYWNYLSSQVPKPTEMHTADIISDCDRRSCDTKVHTTVVSACGQMQISVFSSR